MTPLVKKLKALWLAMTHCEGEDIRFSRGLTIRSRKTRGSAERGAKISGASN